MIHIDMLIYVLTFVSVSGRLRTSLVRLPLLFSGRRECGGADADAPKRGGASRCRIEN